MSLSSVYPIVEKHKKTVSLRRSWKALTAGAHIGTNPGLVHLGLGQHEVFLSPFVIL